MASSSRGSVPPGFQSKSTPNLALLGSLDHARQREDTRRIPVASQPVASPQSPLSNGPASVEGEDEDPFALEDGFESGEEGEEREVGEDGEEGEAGEGEAAEGEAGDETDSPPTSRPLYTSRSYSHLPRQPASALYPPFYNRPPVPLPPSLSLTSLLRPAFSAATSRPTTPDSSDIDLPSAAHTTAANTPTSSTTNLARITHSARNAPTVPRASPKVPTYEYYGFAVYMGSSAAFLMYILWAYVPAPLLHQMGIWWYPDRWWALAVPCWLVVLVVYMYVALASWNTGHLTLPMGSCENLVDETAQVAVVDRRTRTIVRNTTTTTNTNTNTPQDASTTSLAAFHFAADELVDWNALWNVGTDAVMDVPIGGVCEILYGDGR